MELPEQVITMCSVNDQQQRKLIKSSFRRQYNALSCRIPLLCAFILLRTSVSAFSTLVDLRPLACRRSVEPTVDGISPTALFGVRSALKQKLSNLTSSSKRSRSSSNTKTFNPPPSPDEPSIERKPSSTTSLTATLVAADDSALYSLPPVDRSLTKLEREFRDMLEHFANYSPRDILSLRDPRTRAVFEGVAASANEPAVYRAFEVLFEDLYPLRIAGRLIFSKLQALMDQSQLDRQEEVDLVVEQTGLDPTDVEETRLAFVSVAAELNGDSFLTLEQLAETGLGYTGIQVLGFDTVYGFLNRLDQDKKGKLSFTDLMIGLQCCAEEMCAIEVCNPATVMRQIMSELKENPPAYDSRLDAKRQRFSDRYDEMVASFRQWQDLIPEGEGRRLDVVRGCFVGADNKKVVEALRVVYVDYAALRTAGDIIFKLVSSVLNARKKRMS